MPRDAPAVAESPASASAPFFAFAVAPSKSFAPSLDVALESRELPSLGMRGPWSCGRRPDFLGVADAEFIGHELGQSDTLNGGLART